MYTKNIKSYEMCNSKFYIFKKNVILLLLIDHGFYFQYKTRLEFPIKLWIP